MIGRQTRSSSTADGSAHRHFQGPSRPVGFWRPASWLNRALQVLLEERERSVLWLPVGFGLGIALYFALPFEPSLWIIPLLLLPALAMTMFLQRQAVLEDGVSVPILSLITMLLMLIGFGAAQWRTHQVDAPAIEWRGAYQVEGEVLLVEARVKGDRLVLGDLVVENLAADATPAKIRFSRRVAEPPLSPGDRIRVRAMLMPPSPCRSRLFGSCRLACSCCRLIGWEEALLIGVLLSWASGSS